ncbi:MAG: hypothetical protein R2755_19260 [Acidimicrobiales bacterium]
MPLDHTTVDATASTDSGNDAGVALATRCTADGAVAPTGSRRGCRPCSTDIDRRLARTRARRRASLNSIRAALVRLEVAQGGPADAWRGALEAELARFEPGGASRRDRSASLVELYLRIEAATNGDAVPCGC